MQWWWSRTHIHVCSRTAAIIMAKQFSYFKIILVFFIYWRRYISHPYVHYCIPITIDYTCWTCYYVTVCGCHSMWMSQYVEVTVCGCHSMWMSQYVDVTVCGCHSMWMSQYMDVTVCGCHSMWMGLQEKLVFTDWIGSDVNTSLIKSTHFSVRTITFAVCGHTLNAHKCTIVLYRRKSNNCNPITLCLGWACPWMRQHHAQNPSMKTLNGFSLEHPRGSKWRRMFWTVKEQIRQREA